MLLLVGILVTVSIGGLVEMGPRIGTVRVIVGEPAQQFCVERLCQVDGSLDIVVQILIEGHVTVVGPVIYLVQLHLPDR